MRHLVSTANTRSTPTAKEAICLSLICVKMNCPARLPVWTKAKQAAMQGMDLMRNNFVGLSFSFGSFRPPDAAGATPSPTHPGRSTPLTLMRRNTIDLPEITEVSWSWWLCTRAGQWFQSEKKGRAREWKCEYYENVFRFWNEATGFYFHFIRISLKFCLKETRVIYGYWFCKRRIWL